MQEKIGWVVYREEDLARNERFIYLMQQAATRRDIDLRVITYENMTLHLSKHNSLLSNPDHTTPQFVINRSVSPWLNEVTELDGVRCFNSAYIARIANDKRLAHAVLANLDIPMLPTIAGHHKSFVNDQTSHSAPFILKDPLGRGGTGVLLIEREKHMQNLVDNLPKDVIYQPVGGQKGKDLRVYIVANQIVGAVLRESTSDFRANISTGGSARLYDLTKQEKQLIEKITGNIQVDFVGIDFLIDVNGNLLFNEIEDAVGCRSLYMNSSIDIADIFLTHIDQEIYHS